MPILQLFEANVLENLPKDVLTKKERKNYKLQLIIPFESIPNLTILCFMQGFMHIFYPSKYQSESELLSSLIIFRYVVLFYHTFIEKIDWFFYPEVLSWRTLFKFFDKLIKNRDFLKFINLDRWKKREKIYKMCDFIAMGKNLKEENIMRSEKWRFLHW